METRKDFDGDGFVDVMFGGDDCADNDPARHPDATEVCGNDVDEDCDGEAEHEKAWYRDADGDGWGLAELSACEQPDDDYVLAGGDCNDGDAALTPETVWYADQDGDGFGDEQVATGCDAPSGSVLVGGDCSDLDPKIHPDALDDCDDHDTDCDGQVDEDGEERWTDNDGDSYGDPDTFFMGCTGATQPYDCDDADFFVNPSAEACEDRCSGFDEVCERTWEVDDILVRIEAGEVMDSRLIEGVMVGNFREGDNGWLGIFDWPLPAEADKGDAVWYAEGWGGNRVGHGQVLLGDIDGDGSVEIEIESAVVWGPLTGIWDKTYTAVSGDRLAGVDWNRDGQVDLAKRWSSAHVVSFGGTQALSQDVEIQGEQSGHGFGYATVAVDDQVAVLAPSAGALGSGAVYLLDPANFELGSTTKISADTFDQRIEGTEQWPYLDLQDAEDVDGDGHDDLILRVNGASQAFAVVYGPFAADGQTVELSGAILDQAGSTVAAVGNIDGQPGSELFACGTRDAVLVQGARYEGAYLLTAGWGEFIPEEGMLLGSAQPIGDLNGDGVPELACGKAQNSTWDERRIFIWDGNP